MGLLGRGRCGRCGGDDAAAAAGTMWMGSGHIGFDLLLRLGRYGGDDVVGMMQWERCGGDNAAAAALMLRL